MKNSKKEGYTPKINKIKKSREGKVLVQHIRMSVFKAQRIIDLIRGRSYEDVIAITDHLSYRASYLIQRLVLSAVKNAAYNMNLDFLYLIMGPNTRYISISKAEVNRGTIVKKLRPQARGRSYPIKRTTCHIKIVVEVKSELLNLDNPFDFHDYDSKKNRSRKIWDKK